MTRPGAAVGFFARHGRVNLEIGDELGTSTACLDLGQARRASAALLRAIAAAELGEEMPGSIADLFGQAG